MFVMKRVLTIFFNSTTFLYLYNFTYSNGSGVITLFFNLCKDDLLAAEVFFCGEGPRSRCYGRTAVLRLIVQPCDEDD